MGKFRNTAATVAVTAAALAASLFGPGSASAGPSIHNDGSAALSALRAPTSAEAQPLSARQSAIINFDHAYCTVTVHNPHKSGSDISARTGVACYRNSGNGPPYYADNIKIASKIIVLESGSGRTVKECGPRDKDNRYSFDLPCHGPYAGDGIYRGEATAWVTIGGQTKSGTDSNTEEVGR